MHCVASLSVELNQNVWERNMQCATGCEIWHWGLPVEVKQLLNGCTDGDA